MQVCTMKPATSKRSVPEKCKSQITNLLVFLLASISHFELHVYTKQPQGAERLDPEKYKSQSKNLHPRVLRFKMYWYITTFTPSFSFPLVYTADAPSEWQMFQPYKTLKDLGTKSAFLAEQRFINNTWPWIQRKLFKSKCFASQKFWEF